MDTIKKNDIFEKLLNNSDMKNQNIDIKMYTTRWKLFVFVLIISFLFGALYLRYTPKQYMANSSILIDDEERGGVISSELEAFQDLGVLGDSKASIDTEIDILKSRTLMQRVIKKLKVNIEYRTIARIRSREYDSRTRPFNIEFLNKDSNFFNMDTSFTVITRPNQEYEISSQEGKSILVGQFGEKITTSFGQLIINPNLPYGLVVGEGAIVKISPLKNVAKGYLKKLNISAKSKKSNVLVLSVQDVIMKRAEDILNNLVEEYNNDVINDKKEIAQITTDFINNRIFDISKELDEIDSGVQVYKTENQLTDIDFEAGLVLESNSEIDKEIINLNAEIKLIDYILDYMTSNSNELIPVNLGLKDQSTGQSALTYNQLLLERNRILKTSSKMNPTIVNIDSQLKSLRENINRSLMNTRSSLLITLNQAKIQSSRLKAKRNIAPKQEKEFLNIKRKQQIIESLYLYLLEKREENEITYAVNSPNAKVLDVADGSTIPVSPNILFVFIGAFLIGVGVPFCWIFAVNFLDNKVHTIEDLENIITGPILGDISISESKNDKIIINTSENSSAAESFRLLRTNLEFMLPSNIKEGKVICVTSTIGSEGKSFISINLSVSLTLTGKRVLLIASDLRKSKISEYMNLTPVLGLTNYLNDYSVELPDIITPSEISDLEIVASGPIPPNPSELLGNGRFENVIAYGKENYDYIIVDTSPVGLVTDTLIIADQADLFIYVVRANFIKKNMLSVPEKLYNDKRLPNLAFTLNYSDHKKTNYGYGYGYGYSKKKTFWNKLGFK